MSLVPVSLGAAKVLFLRILASALQAIVDDGNIVLQIFQGEVEL